MPGGTRSLLWLTVLTLFALAVGVFGWLAFVNNERDANDRITRERLGRLAYGIAEDGICVRLRTTLNMTGSVPFSLMVPSGTRTNTIDTLDEYLGQTEFGDTVLRFKSIPLEYPTRAEISIRLRYLSEHDARAVFGEKDPRVEDRSSTASSPYLRFLDTARIGRYVDEQLVFEPFRSIDLAIIDTTAGVVLFRRGRMDIASAQTARHAVLVFPDKQLGKPIKIYAEHDGDLFILGLNSIYKLLVYVLALGAIYLIAWKAIRLSEARTRLASMRMDLMSNISHELNTPVANIALALDTLRRPRSGADRLGDQELWQIVEEENRRLRSMIRKVLDVSQLEGRQLALKLEVHDLHFLIERTVQSFKLIASESSCSFDMKLEAVEPWVKVDETHVGNAIQAIVDNAIKYSGRGGHVRVSTWNQDRAVLARFSDDGPGIPKDDREFVFEKFFRARTPDRYATNGTGIGLYYSRQVVQAHGGWLRLEEQRHGTSIVMSFPQEHLTNG